MPCPTILEEGEVARQAEEARKILLRLGRKGLGEPDPAIVARIGSITDLDRIEGLLDRQGDGSNWEDLLSAS